MTLGLREIRDILIVASAAGICNIALLGAGRFGQLVTKLVPKRFYESEFVLVTALFALAERVALLGAGRFGNFFRGLVVLTLPLLTS